MCGGKRPRGLRSGPRAGLDRWQHPVAAPGAAPRTAAVPARPAPASRRASHWAKGRGAEGATLVRQGRSAPVPVPFPLLTRRRHHGEASPAHQPREELLRWRFRGRLPGVRGAPAGHHQGEVARGTRGRGGRPVLGARCSPGHRGVDYTSRQEPRGSGAGPGGRYGRTTTPGRHCAGGGTSGVRRGAAELGLCRAVGRPLAARRLSPGLSEKLGKERRCSRCWKELGAGMRPPAPSHGGIPRPSQGWSCGVQVVM